MGNWASSWTDTVTVLNRLAGGSGFQRTVVSGVRWQGSSGYTVRDKRLEGGDRFEVYFPAGAAAQNSYCDPDGFDENPAGRWTLRRGDIIARGQPEAVPGREQELLSGGDAFTVLGVEDFSRRAAHLKYRLAVGGDWRGR